MKRKKEIPAPLPQRAELSDTPLKLCNEISRLFRTELRERDFHEGVMTQHGAHLVLSLLAINDGINQLELVNKTHLSPPTVSVIVKRMEDEGIVERRNNPLDGRSFCVYLTEKGREMDAENIENIKKVDSVAHEGITEEEFETLMRILPKLRDNLVSDLNKDARKEKPKK